MRRKLTATQIRQIHALRGRLPARKLAGQFRVSFSTIEKIWASEIYSGVQRPPLPEGYRQYRAKGEETCSAKLTARQVIRIRQRLEEGRATQRAMAKKYGVSPRTICKLYHHKSWKHVEAK